MPILINFLLAIYVLIALLMILVILMQRPKSEGLGAAFGGGVTENIFGAQTTNVLVKFTSYLSAFFFALTFALSVLYAHQNSTKSVLREELMKQSATSTPSPTAPTSGSPNAAASVSPAAPAGLPPAAPAVGVVPAGPASAASASASPAPNN